MSRLDPPPPCRIRCGCCRNGSRTARSFSYDLWIYPIVNPTGCEQGRRENWAGKDLNREFWRDSQESEVRIVEDELRLGRFDGLITLHADDTCEGHYRIFPRPSCGGFPSAPGSARRGKRPSS